MIPASTRPVALPRTRKGVDPFVLFAMEGALLQMFTSINGFGNNLYASALGATDQQIGLIQTIPNVAAVLLLLPLGILADRLRSSRTIPLLCLMGVAAGYVLIAAVPALGALGIPMFFMALAFTVGGPVLYGAQWQTFFGDVVRSKSRNEALTLRNRAMFTLGIVTPLACSLLMNENRSTLRVLQILFLLCTVLALSQAAVVGGIQVPLRQKADTRFSLGELTGAVGMMARSKPFLLFFVPVVLFYITWQMDWSMWYIGQVQYLGLTDAQMTFFNGIFNIGQLVAIGLLAKNVKKRGADRTLPLAALGLISCPLTMMVCSMLPQAYRMTSFTLLVTVLNAPQCATNLCIVQILLRVAPKECRSIAVSLYTLTTTLTNCFMPYLGVQMYTAMGANYRALMLFNAVVLVGRIATFGLLIWRCRFVKKEA